MTSDVEGSAVIVFDGDAFRSPASLFSISSGDRSDLLFHGGDKWLKVGIDIEILVHKIIMKQIH